MDKPNFPNCGALLTRELSLDVGKIDTATRRIPAVLSTEFAVLRGDWQEVLRHQPEAIDLSRVPLPLLIQHDGDQLNIGLVENVRLSGRVLRGEVVIGQSARANEIWPDIEAGIVRNLSIAYEVLDFRTDGSLFEVTRWRPYEASLVSVPADPGAGLYRSKHRPEKECLKPLSAFEQRAVEGITRLITDLRTHGVNRAASTTDRNRSSTMPSESTATTDTALQESARLAERERITGIRSLAAAHGAGTPPVDRLVEAAIERGTSVAAFRTDLVEALARRDSEMGGLFNRASSHYFEAGGDFIDAASDGLLLRAGLAPTRSHAGASDFRGRSFADLAKLCISRSGRNLREDSPQVLMRSAMSTSDFPAILEAAMNKAIRLGMESAHDSHRLWCRITQASNLYAQKRVLLGSAPDLLPVLELGEYTHGAMEEDRSSLVPSKYGRMISLSWESLINDNVGAFVGVGPALGRAALRAEADAIYDQLLANGGDGATMQDGKALFHVDHNNTAGVTAAELGASALGAARAKLRRQQAVGGALLNLRPRTLLVPPERETEAEILIAKGTINNASSGLISETESPGWLRQIQVVSDPRLEDTGVAYLLADQSEIDTAEISILDGHPELQEEDSFAVDARRWKMRHVFAAAFLDWRGIVRIDLTAP